MSIRRYEARDGTTTYHVRRRVRDPDTGKLRHEQRTARTKREAERLDAAWQTEIAAGTAIVGSRQTVRALLDDWLAAEASHLASSSYASYALSIRLHLGPTFGHLRLDQLGVGHVEDWYERLLRDGYARKTVLLYATPLHGALARAERRGAVARNVARIAKMPRVGRGRVARAGDADEAEGDTTRAWTREQVAAFLGAAQGTRYDLLWRVLLGTGLRRGEALGLRWGDWEQTATREAPHGRLRIAQIVRSLPRGWEISPAAKSEAGERVVVLTASVAAALHSQQARVATMRSGAGEQWTEHGLVFPAPEGGPVGPNNLRGHYRRCIAAAGVPLLTVHGTRHTFATLALQAKVPVHVVSRMLGHANINITMTVYAHVLSGMEAEAVTIMDSVIFGDAPAAVQEANSGAS
jgi:integrase